MVYTTMTTRELVRAIAVRSAALCGRLACTTRDDPDTCARRALRQTVAEHDELLRDHPRLAAKYARQLAGLERPPSRASRGARFWSTIMGDYRYPEPHRERKPLPMIDPKPGDTMAALWAWTGGPRTTTLTVERLTPKQIIAVDQHGKRHRFWRHSRRGVGGDMGRLMAPHQAAREIREHHAREAQRTASQTGRPFPVHT